MKAFFGTQNEALEMHSHTTMLMQRVSLCEPVGLCAEHRAQTADGSRGALLSTRSQAGYDVLHHSESHVLAEALLPAKTNPDINAGG